ncbi:MAG TPA: hypothetical protein VG502_16270 [Flexivirga sp.]|uniref:hypothetical protein n=1 Tax=Flexivirga sp. TaxID=1962927 RepID=UPI002C1F410F|nr:hypothetical protein [Flexivirga sp.]HWC23852.1 hypothetical protein [Flexivirga sp.]
MAMETQHRQPDRIALARIGTDAEGDDSQPPGEIPVASASEWRRHVAHRTSPGQIVGRLVLGPVLMASVVYAILMSWTAPDGLVDVVERMSAAPVSTWTKVKYISVVVGAFALIDAGVAAAWLWFAWRTLLAIRFRLMRAWHRLALQFNACVSQPPMVSDSDRVLVPMLSVGILGSCVFADITFISTVVMPAPLIVWPVFVIAMGLATFVLFRTFFGRDDDATLLQVWITLLPVLRRQKLPVSWPATCTVCCGARRPRPVLIRAGLVLLESNSRVLDRLETSSVWIVYLRRHWTVASLVAGIFVALGLMNAADVPLPVGAAFLTTCLCLPILRLAVSTKRSVFDGMIDGFTTGGPFRLMGAIVACFALMGNGILLEHLVVYLAGPAKSVFHGYDPNLAMLAFIAAEACACYIVYSVWQTRRGFSPRWSPKQVVIGTFLPIIGLMVGALQGGWYPMALLTATTWVSAQSKPERDCVIRDRRQE